MMIKKPGKQEVLLVAGALTGIWCAYELFRFFKTRKQDFMAGLLLEELTRVLNPETKGLLNEKAFSANYKQEVLNTVRGQVLTLQPQVALYHAEKIYNSFGSWVTGGDDEQAIYGVFNQLKDKVQVSQVASAYLYRYGRSLTDKLNEKFDTGEIRKVLAIVSSKPPYRVLK